MKFACKTALSFVLMIGACNGGATLSTREQPDITSQQAQMLALTRYRQLFGDKFLFNPISNKYYPWPALDETKFDTVEKREGYWWVSADPETGVVIDARVDRKGKWVEVLRVSVAFQ